MIFECFFAFDLVVIDGFSLNFCGCFLILAFDDGSDNLLDYEEYDGDTDVEVDYPCPFCSEDFDIVGLCCHIEEEHYDEAKRGVLCFYLL